MDPLCDLPLLLDAAESMSFDSSLSDSERSSGSCSGGGSNSRPAAHSPAASDDCVSDDILDAFLVDEDDIDACTLLRSCDIRSDPAPLPCPVASSAAPLGSDASTLDVSAWLAPDAKPQPAVSPPLSQPDVKPDSLATSISALAATLYAAAPSGGLLPPLLPPAPAAALPPTGPGVLLPSNVAMEPRPLKRSRGADAASAAAARQSKREARLQRNRESANRSRLRRKRELESLQEEADAVREENGRLRELLAAAEAREQLLLAACQRAEEAAAVCSHPRACACSASAQQHLRAGMEQVAARRLAQAELPVEQQSEQQQRQRQQSTPSAATASPASDPHASPTSAPASVALFAIVLAVSLAFDWPGMGAGSMAAGSASVGGAVLPETPTAWSPACLVLAVAQWAGQSPAVLEALGSPRVAAALLHATLCVLAVVGVLLLAAGMRALAPAVRRLFLNPTPWWQRGVRCKQVEVDTLP